MDQNRICMGCMREKGSDAAKCPDCGFVEGTEAESPLFLPPRTVLEGKYLVGRVLGQGGFGITYLAWDLNLNVKLAIKEYFPQELASRAAGHSQVSAYSGSLGGQYDYGLDKFLQEARTLAQFEGHPNIVSVRDFFKANGTAYFVMSYVEGITVKDHLANSGGTLPLDQAHGIIMPVLDALKEVHSVNILHRDISPDNIFINQKGQVILIDFGAARQAAGEKGHSLSIILKPGYAPEEQYRSKGVQGPWTDIYAVGATFYHLITGRQPPEALERLVEDNLVPPRELGVTIGEDEEKALLTALAVRSPDRYQNVADFQAGLTGKQAAVATTVPVPRPVEETAGKAPSGSGKKIPTGIMAGAGALVVLGIVLITLWAGGVIGGDTAAVVEEAEAEEEAETVPTEVEEVETEEPEEQVDPVDEPADENGDDQTGEVEEAEEEVTRGPEQPVEDVQEKVEEAGEEQEEQEEPAQEQPAAEPPAEEKQEEPADTIQDLTISWEGGTYTGPVKNGVPHGQGSWSHPSGRSYKGDFYEGRITGYGTMNFPGGERYVGYLRNGKAHGEGTMYHPDGRKVSGEWLNGTLRN